MPWLFAIPVAIFIACALGQVWVLRRLRQALVQRHPDLWLEMSYKAWFIDRALYNFAFFGRHKALDDPVVSDCARLVPVIFGIAVLALIALPAMTVIGVGFPQG